MRQLILQRSLRHLTDQPHRGRKNDPRSRREQRRRQFRTGIFIEAEKLYDVFDDLGVHKLAVTRDHGHRTGA